MERFLSRHRDRVLGTLSGFDRLLFRGTLRSIAHVNGLEIFLSSQHVLHKEFGSYVQILSKRIIDHAKLVAEKEGRRYEYVESSKASKEDIAKRIIAEEGITEGLICVLTCVEPCQSFEIRKNPKRKWLDLVSKERKCLHLYFYYLDRDFGLMHVRLQTWLPFTIQVCINGREWLARQMKREGMQFTQRDNCFTNITDFNKAQEIMDQLTERRWTGLLNMLANRVNPLIKRKAGLDIRGYYWSVRQGEYATDVVFCDSESLSEIYPRLVQHAMFQFTSDDVMRFLQRKTKAASFDGEVSTRFERRIEGTRVKHWVEENWIKIYDKQGSVLRVETIINNPRRFTTWRRATRKGKLVMAWLPMRKGIADLARRVQLSKGANRRYLDALSVVGLGTPSHRLTDAVSKPLQVEGRRHRALQPISPKDADLFRAVLRGENLIQGFRNKDLRTALGQQDSSTSHRESARMSRQLALLRAHQLIYKVPKTNYYRITMKGHEIIATALRFRDDDVVLLAT